MSQPYVLERGSGVAVAYCGRLLGLMGADVVKVEAPGGDPMRSRGLMVPAAAGPQRGALWEYLGCYKRSVVLDAATGSGSRALDRLVAGVDVVIDDHDGDPAAAMARWAAARAVNPRVVYLVVSSFGLTGPYRPPRGSISRRLRRGGHPHRGAPVPGGRPGRRRRRPCRRGAERVELGPAARAHVPVGDLSRCRPGRAPVEPPGTLQQAEPQQTQPVHEHEGARGARHLRRSREAE